MKPLLASCLAVATLACAGPRFELDELPTEPIAIVYRTVEEADRVLDMFQQQEKARRKQSPGASGRFEVGL
jgi:hypothetical protein